MRHTLDPHSSRDRRGARLRSALLAVPAAVALLGGSAAPARSDEGPAAPSGPATQLIVTFKNTAGAAEVKDTLGAAGADQVGTVSLSGAAIVAVPAGDSAAALDTLQADPDVASARVDPVVHALLTPNDPVFAANPSQSWEWQEQNLPAAWDLTTGSDSVTVAVVDTGVDAAHEDLAGSVLPGWNAITGTSDTADDHGHGTEVAGMIAAHGNNAIGVAGSCWSCKILPVKVLDSSGSGYTSTIANGITWAVDHGAKVINLSIGGSPDPAYVSALNYATSHGVFVAVAAGNNGSSSPSASYPGGYGISMPGVVSVGALDADKRLYNFSNYGSWVEVAAPGCELTTAMDGAYTTMCGTSAAAPQVAGAAALALSYDPALTPAELEAKLEATAGPAYPVERLDGSGNAVSCGGPCSAFGLIDDAQLLTALGASPPANEPPALVDAPSLSGTAAVGETLSGSDATFSGSGTISTTHGWERCDASGANCRPVGGADGTTYTPVAADEGLTLRFQTTASNAYGRLSASSDASAVVAAASGPATGAPAASSSGGGGGASPPDLTLTAGAGAGTITAGGTVELDVSVFSRTAGGATGVHLSAALPAGATLVGSSVTRGSGCVQSGRNVDCNLDFLSPPQTADVHLSVSFAAAGSFTIPLTVSTRDRDTDLSNNQAAVPVTVTEPAVPSVSPSRVPALRPPRLLTRPALLGTARVGRRLSAASGRWQGSGLDLSYRWSRCDADGRRCVRLATTTRSYLVQRADLGRRLAVTVSARNHAGIRHARSFASKPVLPAVKRRA